MSYFPNPASFTEFSISYKTDSSSIVAGKTYFFPLIIFFIVPLRIFPDLVFGNLSLF